MNYTLFFLCCSLGILVLSFVTICISPIINNASKSDGTWTWSISSWRTLNCQFLADKQNSDTSAIDDIQKYKRLKNLCYKKKAMHNLEYAALIIDIVIGFVCVNLSFLHYLNVGKDFEKKTGLIGLITGIVCFVLTLVYICYNGDIFNNDVAYANFGADYDYDLTQGVITKLFPNGALSKNDGTNNIRAYQGETDMYSEYIKYKDLGKKQYNYDANFYKIYQTTTCKGSCSCDYCYPDSILTFMTSIENRDLYDRWLATLILSIIIDICCLGLSIFGFLLFKSSKGDSGGEKTVPIN
jgi:hypothetical protein